MRESRCSSCYSSITCSYKHIPTKNSSSSTCGCCKKGDKKMPLNRGSLMVVVEKRKRRIVENDEITVAEQLANEATNGAAEPASASDSEP